MKALPEQSDGPLISVITATYNLLSQGRGDSFREVVACLRRQDCARFEHVIQDGASTDGTIDFIREYTRIDRFVRIQSTQDAGLYDAMNRAVAAARGDYVLFLNSDDALASDDVLNAAADALEASRPDFLFGATAQQMGAGGIHIQNRMSLKAVLQRMPFCHNSVFIRREVFLALGGHDLSFPVAADYDMMLRMIAAGYRGERLEHPVSLFWTRGVSGDDERTAQDYARIWMKFFDGYSSAKGLTVEDFVRFYKRGHMPAALVLDVLRRRGQSEALRAAARHSLFKTIRRNLQPWRKF